jgi:hypothetical protein
MEYTEDLLSLYVKLKLWHKDKCTPTSCTAVDDIQDGLRDQQFLLSG